MATDLATYYVNVVPTTKGIGGTLASELGDSAKEGAKQFGNNFVGILKKIVVAAGIGKVIGDSIKEGASLEQSIGGIETLFKDSAGKMQQYAAEAYKNAGVSANTYMEQVTSFSARLLQGVGGDTEKAADIANRAMVDMSDNANKFGTDIASIQNAYQGFAKANYTMLDNLKLGYGGTKTEMERLIKDAAAMTDVQKELGVTVDANSMSFDNIINAISVVQSHLGVMGTTQEEALTTFSGSMGAMKAAWQNVVGYVAIGSPQVGTAVKGLAETSVQFIENAVPMIENIFTSLPPALIEILAKAGPRIIESGINLIVRLAEGLIQAIPQMVEQIPTIIQSLVTGIQKYLPTIITTGINLVVALAKGLVQAIPNILNELPKLIRSVLQALGDGFSASKLGQIGRNLVQGLWNGINNAKQWVLDKIKGFGNSILNGLKRFFGIHSPSTLFRDEIGKNLALGLGIGFEKNIPIDDMTASLTHSFDDVVYDTLNGMDANLSLSAANVTGTNYDSALGNTNYGGVAINVYATPNQSVQEIAEAVNDILNNDIIRQRAVFANG